MSDGSGDRATVPLGRRTQTAELGEPGARSPFLTMLRDEGRHAVEAFGAKHGAAPAARSTCVIALPDGV